MKQIVILITIFLPIMTACTQQSPEKQEVVGSLHNYRIVCLGEIKYYESDSALSPMVSRNGHFFVSCD